MQTAYAGGQTAQFGGDIKPAVLLGTGGPTSYSQTLRDPVSNPGTGDYIAFPMAATTVSRNYFIDFYPLAVNDIIAGAPSANVSGWIAVWSLVATGAEVAGGTNLSAEQVQFGCFITQL